LCNPNAEHTGSLLAEFAGGTLFGFGLALSSMISPEVIRALCASATSAFFSF
jgi:hypothetical protein